MVFNTTFKNTSAISQLSVLLVEETGVPGEKVSSFSGNQAAMSEGPVVGQHRVLLFCQLKSMLEIVENDLLK
jgi:TATA-binding protein-associated factor